jgi:hypothetical protein
MLRIGSTGDAASAIASYRSISKRADCNKPSHQEGFNLKPFGGQEQGQTSNLFGDTEQFAVWALLSG